MRVSGLSQGLGLRGSGLKVRLSATLGLQVQLIDDLQIAKTSYKPEGGIMKRSVMRPPELA